MADETECPAREALESMCVQFAFDTTMNDAPALATGGLSALEEAFVVLGWSDPHPIEWDKCDEPGCPKRTSCGFPTPAGYRRTCGDHARAAGFLAKKDGAMSHE